MNTIPENVKINRPAAAKMIGAESQKQGFECAAEEAVALYRAGFEPADDPTGSVAAGQPWWWIKKSAPQPVAAGVRELEPWQVHLWEGIYAHAVKVTGDQPDAHRIANAALAAALSAQGGDGGTTTSEASGGAVTGDLKYLPAEPTEAILAAMNFVHEQDAVRCYRAIRAAAPPLNR